MIHLRKGKIAGTDSHLRALEGALREFMLNRQPPEVSKLIVTFGCSVESILLMTSRHIRECCPLTKSVGRID